MTLQGKDAAAFARDIKAGAPGIATVRQDGRDWIQAYGPLGRFGGRGVSIVVGLPYSVVDAIRGRADVVVQQAFSNQLVDASVFAAIAMALAALAAVWAAKSLTAPIQKLHDAARRLAGGDFSVRLDTHRKDELGDLARGFNRMVPAIEDRVRVKKDLGVAREIQQHLLPKTAPAFAGFDIAGRTVFCDETGGDYFDFIPLTVGDEDGLAVVVGDVTGHGIGAALLMTTTRATIRAAAEAGARGGALISAANRQLARDASGGRFMTMFAIVPHAEARAIDWISAGHEPALLYDPGADGFTTLQGDGIPLGVDAGWTYRSETLELPEGGIVVFTDGIRECKDKDGREFGPAGVEAAVRSAKGRGAQVICERILEQVTAHLGGAPAVDDMTVIVVRAAG